MLLFTFLICMAALCLSTTIASASDRHKNEKGIQQRHTDLHNQDNSPTYLPTAKASKAFPTYQPTVDELSAYELSSYYLHLHPVVETSYEISVGSIRDESIADVNACSTTELLSTCNLRSAWALCMSLIQAVTCPSSASQAVSVACAIILPTSSSIAFKSGNGGAMTLSALSSWAPTCDNCPFLPRRQHHYQ